MFGIPPGCGRTNFAACPLAFVLAREVIFDMTLTFLVTVAMVAFWLVEESGFPRPWFEALMFAAMGLAVITKGFVGVLIPLVAILIYHAARGARGNGCGCDGVGVLVLLSAALPWFIAVSMRNPDFPRYALWNESLKRFTTTAAHRGGGIFYYIPVFLGGFFPGACFCSWRVESPPALAGTQARGAPACYIFAELGGMGIPLFLAFPFQASHLFSAGSCSAQHPDGAGLAGSGQASCLASAGLADGRICFVVSHRRIGGRRLALMAL